ncbi:MAG: CTP synthase [Lachnospiraceae bacterium]|nr:CTP synthase [Lachnospiraceae bacterium]
MGVKYVFVTGGVVSGLGKGITASCLGRLLKARGFSVTMQKFDPYINIDPGTMNPIQHGEVYVTEDGTETDLDLGHYERFIDENLNRNSNVTTGKIYEAVLQKERHGDFGGGTVQVIPHITNEIKSRFYKGETPEENRIAIIEVGGTTGDIESQPFLEAIRQFRADQEPGNVIHIHVTLVPYLRCSGELKTKPTQASVRELQSLGLRPDIIVCRSEYPLTDDIRAKIALFCNVSVENVIQNLDVEYLYEAPLVMEQEHLADVALKALKLTAPAPDLTEWKQLVDNLKHPEHTVKIAVVGKYTQLHDSYLSVAEALKHGGIACKSHVDVLWVDSETLTEENVKQVLSEADGILIPGGFGKRGTEGMILAAKYAREYKVPFLGICLGMQMAIVEFARNVLGYADANSTEFDPESSHPMIHILPEKAHLENLGGTLRLGAYPCRLATDSAAYKLYGSETISERHRHRYEVNNDYREALEAAGMKICGTSPDGHIVEMIEIVGHPYYTATQAHPEFKSRPNKAHPLFAGLVAAAVSQKENA